MADKGKIVVIKDGEGGIIKHPKTGVEYGFAQANHKQLCLNVGDKVKFDLLSIKGGTTECAVNVERITAGVVLSVDGAGSGFLAERQTDKKVAFYQPFSTEQAISVGDVVRYTLIPTDRGELAVNLVEVDE